MPVNTHQPPSLLGSKVRNQTFTKTKSESTRRLVNGGMELHPEALSDGALFSVCSIILFFQAYPISKALAS